MSINIDNTNGIVTELQTQRNSAFNQAAMQAGNVAELKVALAAAQKRIAELEAQAKPVEKVAAEFPPPKKPNGKGAIALVPTNPS